MFRHDKVAQPPAGHGECLGKTVDNHRVVREFQHGVFRSSAVGQTVIDFIGYHQGHIFRAELETVVLMSQGLGGNAARHAHKAGVTGVTGIGEDDLVARVEQGLEEHGHTGRGAGKDEHSSGCDACAVSVSVMFRHGFTQFKIAHGMCIMGTTFIQSPFCRVHDAGRRGEVRFTDFHVNDACSSTSMTRKEVTFSMREAGRKVDMPETPVEKLRDYGRKYLYPAPPEKTMARA